MLLGYIISCNGKEEITIETDRGSFSFFKGEGIKTVRNEKIHENKYSVLRNIVNAKSHLIYITDDSIAYIEIPSFAITSIKEELYSQIN